MSPGSGLSQALAEDSGSCTWSHSGVGLWPCLWPQAAAFPWDQLVDQGCNVPYMSYKLRGEGHLPKTAICSLNLFFFFFVLL